MNQKSTWLEEKTGDRKRDYCKFIPDSEVPGCEKTIQPLTNADIRGLLTMSRVHKSMRCFE